MKRTFLSQPHARGAPSVAVVSATVALFVALAGSNAALAAPQDPVLIGNGEPTSVRGVIPEEWSGNPDCADIGFENASGEITGSGTYGPFTVIYDGGTKMVDWSSTIGVDAVIIKGGDLTNIYRYDEYKFDQGLAAPKNASGGPAGLSHLYFCYDNELRAEKTAEARWYKNINWTITKTATPLEASANVGEGAIFGYEVAVSKEEIPGPYFVKGTITVTNESAITADFGVSDSVGDVAATVSCPKNSLVPGESVVCTYSAELDAATDGTNTATITSQTMGIGGAWASADYSFGAAILKEGSEPEQINVTDTNGQSWMTAASATWIYNVPHVCSIDAGAYVEGSYSTNYPNMATITNTTGDRAEAGVTLNCYAPIVSKTAVPYHERFVDWTIDKSVVLKEPAGCELPSCILGNTNTFLLEAGEDNANSGTADYTVLVKKTETYGNWSVSGVITVANPNPSATMTVNLTDQISGGITPDQCQGQLTVPAGSSESCNYGPASLPDRTSRTNIVTATLNGGAFTASADFAFVDGQAVHTGEPDEITVTDTEEGEAEVILGTSSADDAFHYDVTKECSTNRQDYADDNFVVKRPNKAKIVETNNDEDTETVTWECVAPPQAALDVDKTATPKLVKTWTWTVDKSADQTALTLSSGQLLNVNYTVDYDATSEDAYTAFGTIKITNLSTEETVISIVDTLPVNLRDCTGFLSGHTTPAGTETIAALGIATCSYDITLENGNTVTNTVTVTGTDDLGTLDFTDSAAIDFTNVEPEIIDECVTVSDTNTTLDPSELCAPDVASHSYTYVKSFGDGEDADVKLVCGSNSHENTADFLANDTGTTGEDTWTVTAEVECLSGCTLTPGYWKTHSQKGPAPYDDTWALLDATLQEGKIFFLSGQSYYQVLWTPPQGGNAYYILAHAYIAAELNFLNKADKTSEVQAAFDAATGLFNANTPADVAAAKGKAGNALRAQFIQLAGILDAYNNGLTGPGHCSEDYSSGQ